MIEHQLEEFVRGLVRDEVGKQFDALKIELDSKMPDYVTKRLQEAFAGVIEIDHKEWNAETGLNLDWVLHEMVIRLKCDLGLQQ